ncbi:hypothetical protein [Apilactobacillus ozensis]|nr:hypothetical protein [Apilactobacillus ozensis]
MPNGKSSDVYDFSLLYEKLSNLDYEKVNENISEEKHNRVIDTKKMII